MTQIGKNIKKIRNVKGLSQQTFADLFGITRGNISSYEELRAEPKIETVIKIANYFGIPLIDFIEKELSVNELLHYNTTLVVETEKLKITQQLVHIPFIPVFYINDFIHQCDNEEFLHNLPQLVVPSHSKFKLIALEIENKEELPVDLHYNNGDVLIFEEVIKENMHHIFGKLGMMVNESGIKFGLYQQDKDQITLALNSWVSYPFCIDSLMQYWVLKASYNYI